MAKPKQRHLIDDFAAALKAALDFFQPTSETEMAFRDREYLEPGYDWAKVIPKAICHSRCMLLVYNEEYFSREYCVKEFLAMRELELKRGFGGDSDESLIIPLVVQAKSEDRGRARLPTEISKLFYVDFRGVVNPKQQFKTSYLLKKVQQLTDRASRFREKSKSPGVDCESFSFDREVELKPPPESASFPGHWISLASG
jgi:TIR domain